MVRKIHVNVDTGYYPNISKSNAPICLFFGADGDGDDDGDAHKPSLSQRSTHPLDCCMLMLPSGLVAWEWLVAIHEQAPLFTDSLHQHTLSFKAHFHEQTNSYGRDLSSYQKCRSSYT